MTTNLFCPKCKKMLNHKNYGLICDNCSPLTPQKFKKSSFVKDRKNPQYDIGRILEALDNDIYLVNFKSERKKISAKDLENYVLPKRTMVNTEIGQGFISEYHTSPTGQSFYKIIFPSGPKTVEEKMIKEIVPEKPIETIKKYKMDLPQNFALKIMAKYFQLAQYSEDLICIWNSRLDLLPHQVGVTHRVIKDYSPRFILADEVGLGKTMEAGLIMKELKSRGLVNRTLIVTPASLVTQWQQELKSKFNEKFEIFDTRSEAVYKSNNPDMDVFSLYDNVLCSINYAKNRIEKFSNQYWDLIIFDEAHHLRRQLSGKDVRYTKNYRFAEAMGDRCNAMLLLTATPMQLDQFEFYSLIELIDPSLFKSYERFEWYNDVFAPDIKKTLAELRNMDWAKYEKNIEEFEKREEEFNKIEEEFNKIEEEFNKKKTQTYLLLTDKYTRNKKIKDFDKKLKELDKRTEELQKILDDKYDLYIPTLSKFH